MPEKITKIKGIICRNKMTTEQCPVCGGMGMNKNEAESTDTLTVHDIVDCTNCNGTGCVDNKNKVNPPRIKRIKWSDDYGI